MENQAQLWKAVTNVNVSLQWAGLPCLQPRLCKQKRSLWQIFAVPVPQVLALTLGLFTKTVVAKMPDP